MNAPKHLYFIISCSMVSVLLFCPAIEAKIVFCAAGDIMVMNDNGGGKRRLTNAPQWYDSYPRWSPDGKQIVFVREMKENRQNSYELFVINADGTNLQRLTDNNARDGYPSWSPDGKKIVFASSRTGQMEVYVIDVATRHVTQLTNIEGVEVGQGSAAPDWSPDGTAIVYEKFIRSGNAFSHKNIYVMDATGENQRPLLPDPEPGADEVIMRFFPRWSSDGQQVIFDDYLFGANVQRVMILRIGGRAKVVSGLHDKVDLLSDDFLFGTFSWTANDSALLFDVKFWDRPNANYDIYRYEFKTRNLRRLTWGEKTETRPDWIEGALSVSPKEKKTITWGALKQSAKGE